MTKRYSEVIQLPDYKSRFFYLKLRGRVGVETFGDRALNQVFYSSYEWRSVRREVILRDNGCDLALAGYELDRFMYVHHIEPITEEDILNRSDKLMDLENLITVSADTHRAIHYGDESYLSLALNGDRYPGDTCPWKES